MGLDSVEIIMGWEQAFGIEIANEEAELLGTSRMAIDLICKKLRVADGPEPFCLTARAYYRLRRSVVSAGGVPRRAVCPQAKVAELFNRKGNHRLWKLVGLKVGATRWPQMYFGWGWNSRATTIADAVNWLVREEPEILRGQNEPWTRGFVRAVVRAVVVENIGTDDFTDDNDFVKDLGLD